MYSIYGSIHCLRCECTKYYSPWWGSSTKTHKYSCRRKLNCSLHLSALTVLTLTHIGKQAVLAGTLESFKIDARCICKTCAHPSQSRYNLIRSLHCSCIRWSGFELLGLVLCVHWSSQKSPVCGSVRRFCTHQKRSTKAWFSVHRICVSPINCSVSSTEICSECFEMSVQQTLSLLLPIWLLAGKRIAHSRPTFDYSRSHRERRLPHPSVFWSQTVSGKNNPYPQNRLWLT